jgi:uncharacterized membrane protein
MNLKQNSISARLYRWFYNQKTMPESLCPYFWKLLLMWVFIVPYTIISLPFIVIGDDLGEKSSIKAMMGFLYWVIIGLLLTIVFALFTFWKTFPVGSPLDLIQKVGFISGACGVIIFATVYILVNYEDWRFRNSFSAKKKKQDSILVSFVKAKYNKYCPKITWK